MATYNGEKYIKKQIDSILCQLSQEDELVISDDGSTDKTVEIINSYNDSRIKIINHKKNENNRSSKYKNFLYAKENFENAIINSTGDYIFLSDQDDIWLAGKVKRTLELLKKYDCVVHNYQIINMDDNLIKDAQFRKSPLHKSIFMNVVDNHFRGCCMAFNAKFKDSLFPIPKRVVGHDYWIGTLLAHYGNVFYELQPFIQSRWYENSVSAKKKTSIFYKFEFRFVLFAEIIFFLIKKRGIN